MTLSVDELSELLAHFRESQPERDPIICRVIGALVRRLVRETGCNLNFHMTREELEESPYVAVVESIDSTGKPYVYIAIEQTLEEVKRGRRVQQ